MPVPNGLPSIRPLINQTWHGPGQPAMSPPQTPMQAHGNAGGQRPNSQDLWLNRGADKKMNEWMNKWMNNEVQNIEAYWIGQNNNLRTEFTTATKAREQKLQNEKEKLENANRQLQTKADAAEALTRRAIITPSAYAMKLGAEQKSFKSLLGKVEQARDESMGELCSCEAKLAASEHSVKDLQKRNDSLALQLEAKERTVKDVTAENDSVKNEKKSVEAKVALLEKRKAAYESENADLSQAVLQGSRDLIVERGNSKTLQADVDDLRTQIAAATATISALAKSAKLQDERIEQLQSDKNMLDDLQSMLKSRNDAKGVGKATLSATGEPASEPPQPASNCGKSEKLNPEHGTQPNADDVVEGSGAETNTRNVSTSGLAETEPASGTPIEKSMSQTAATEPDSSRSSCTDGDPNGAAESLLSEGMPSTTQQQSTVQSQQSTAGHSISLTEPNPRSPEYASATSGTTDTSTSNASQTFGSATTRHVSMGIDKASASCSPAPQPLPPLSGLPAFQKRPSDSSTRPTGQAERQGGRESGKRKRSNDAGRSQKRRADPPGISGRLQQARSNRI